LGGRCGRSSGRNRPAAAGFCWPTQRAEGFRSPDARPCRAPGALLGSVAGRGAPTAVAQGAWRRPLGAGPARPAAATEALSKTGLPVRKQPGAMALQGAGP
jgi:hypothetical protein